MYLLIDLIKTQSGIFVNFRPEFRECPFFAFRGTKNRAKKGPCKKGVQKGPSTVFVTDVKDVIETFY